MPQRRERATIGPLSDDTPTLGLPAARPNRKAAPTPGLTILWHPDVSRVGERVRLWLDPTPTDLSRRAPVFASADGRTGGPLDDPYVSRKTAWLSAPSAGVIELTVDERAVVNVDRDEVRGSIRIDSARLDRGVVITLSRRVALFLHRMSEPTLQDDSMGMVGASEALQRVRADIAHVAGLDVPVLIRGESGTGKELVARALHERSLRRSRRMVAVNLAAITAGTAGSELFGHARGAFTGAANSHDGFFVQAHEGTLFLDEIGAAAPELQVMLLRALESGEIQPVGGRGRRQVNVRLVSATDAELESLVDRQTFSMALLHRLAGYRIDLPALRERREDLGRLLLHFLREELNTLGAAKRLTMKDKTDEPWLSAELVARLALHAWPGNLRELRNAARQIAVRHHAEPTAALPRVLEQTIAPPAPEDAPGTDAGLRLRPADISDAMLLAALDDNGWSIRPTARQLQISKTTLYGLIEKADAIRGPAELTEEQVEGAAARLNTASVSRIAADLRASPAAVRALLKGT